MVLARAEERHPVLTYDEFKERRHFAGLDGLRALSITLVILHHTPRFASEFLRNLQEHGTHGVSLFFVISGFLISSLLLREQEQFGRVSLKRFFARRAFRLFPLYYAVFAGVFLATQFTHVFTAESARMIRDNVFAYLFYFSNWLPTAKEGPFFFSWSLAAEEQFYLAFGLTMLLLPRRVLLHAVGVLLILKAAAVLVLQPDVRQGTLWRVTLSYQEPIIWGVLAGFALNSRRIYGTIARWLNSSLVVASVALLCAAWMTFRAPGANELLEERILFPLLAVVVAAVAMRPRVPFLDLAACRHVGRVSYGMYLIHWFMLVALARVLPQGTSLALFLVLAMAVIVAVASLLFTFFERPMIEFGKARFGSTAHRIAGRAGTTAPDTAPAAAAPQTLAVGLSPNVCLAVTPQAKSASAESGSRRSGWFKDDHVTRP